MFCHLGHTESSKETAHINVFIISAYVAVQAKVQMLDNLLDIEVAYSLLRGGAQDNENDPIDINYDKLKTKIEVRSVDTWIMYKIVYIFLQNNARMVISMHGK